MCDTLFDVASVAILVLFAWIALQSVIQAWVGGQIPTVGEVLSSIMFFVWSAIGLLICVTSVRGSKISSASSGLSWPFLLFMKSPIVASFLTLVLALFSGGGEFLGRALGYSMVGAWLGLALLAVLVFVTATGGWGRNDSFDPR